MWTDYFKYEDGKLFWVLRDAGAFATSRAFNVHKSKYAGKQAGSLGNHGYLSARVGGKPTLVHRIIWEMHNGPIPDGMEVDHIDTVRTNNHISNLRLATSSNNKWNMNKPSHNTSGFKGVSLFKATGRYEAYIKINGKKKHLGFYASAEQAHSVYTAEAIRLFGEFNRNGN